MFIEEFKIYGLFGFKDVEINFTNPILILIGENGFGKTTILNALNFTLQGRYKELSEIKFNEIVIKINDKSFSFTHSLLSRYNLYLKSKRHSLSVYPEGYGFYGTDYYSFLFDSDDSESPESKGHIRHSLSNLSPKVISKLTNEFLKEVEVFNSLKTYIDSFKYKILFKPTYRRVEADLSSTFSEDSHNVEFLNIKSDNNFNQDYAATIIRFGMKDVQQMIKSVTDEIQTSSLSGFAKVSSDMIRHLLDEKKEVKPNYDFNIDELRIILARTGDNFSDNEKKKIIEQIENKDITADSNLVYFLNQLYKVYKSQEKFDTAIKKFRDVCNGYLQEKIFVYDESRVDLKIYRTLKDKPLIDDKYIVDLNTLSSGEKQIVSLFAQIYLDIDQKFVMLLDEPELSLSIYWQETLLSDIYNSGRCEFLLAVTHSPFIFRKSMKEYVVGLQEFQKNRTDYE